MKVDLREKMKREQEHRKLPDKHRALFESRLEEALHKESSPSPWAALRVAASILLLFGMGYWGLNQFSEPNAPGLVESNQPVPVSLEQYSPELKKIETYYLTAIGMELARLDIDQENKAQFDPYFRKLEKMSKDYEALNARLKLDEIDEDLINDLIDNLQTRLNVMIELKNEIKKQKEKRHVQDKI